LNHKSLSDKRIYSSIYTREHKSAALRKFLKRSIGARLQTGLTTTVAQSIHLFLKKQPLFCYYLADVGQIPPSTTFFHYNQSMSNQLIYETSPYLLQHAHNPVNWYPWGEEALQRAQIEDKPIFLSIGYAACHWCHVMEKESFEDPRIAEFLNQYFISIKVDREERPDLDSIYMSAVIAMTGQGGWPMSIFLTPLLQPFYGGTYFPPIRRYGMPSFFEVLQGIHRAWIEDHPNLLNAAHRLTEYLQSQTQFQSLSLSTNLPAKIQQASQKLIQTFNPQTGGWGHSPLFPQPMAIEFLLMQAQNGNAEALITAETSLKAMQRGGIYDVLGGGFHRYSTDEHWLVPHFEKMLYDNAQLARIYLHAYQQTNNPLYRETCQATLDFLLQELRNPQGGFYSSLDADSADGEGFYYTWEDAELHHFLTTQEYQALSQAFSISPNGCFQGRNILQWREQPILSIERSPTLQNAIQRLITIRQQRTRPAADDKILTSWNAFTAQTLAEAGRALQRPDYLAAAQQNLHFLLTNLRHNNRLLRSWRADHAHLDAYLEDYAALILALLATYQADFDPSWYHTAQLLAKQMVSIYADPQGGFFDVPQNASNLLLRPKDLQDNATPSGNALAALALLTLQTYGETYPEPTLPNDLTNHPLAFGYWLQVLTWLAGPVHQIALIWPSNETPPPQTLMALHAPYRPLTVIAASPLPSTNAIPLLQNRPLQNQSATLYLCQGFTCQNPINSWPSITNALNTKNLTKTD
jgi:uncharacterized protein YyaL (SSP411 family)